MNFDSIPVKQAPAQANPSSSTAKSPGSRGPNDAAPAFESYLTEARGAPKQTQEPNERRGNTTKTPENQTTANKSESESESIDSVGKNRETDDETTAVTSEAPTPGSVSATAASNQPDDETKKTPASETSAESGAIVDAQQRFAAQMATLATANPTQATTASAVHAQYSPTQSPENGNDDVSRISDQTIMAASFERKGIRKESISRGQDESPGGAVGEAVLDAEQQADSKPNADFSRAAAPAKPGKSGDTVGAGGSGFEHGVGEGKNKSGEQDFASLLIPAMNSASTIRLHAEPISSGSATTPLAVQQYELGYSPESPRFGSSLAGHLSTIISQSVERADIQLNPRELGPIRVEVSVKDRETNVTLIASEPRTIAAIEQSSNMLRTLLTDQGLTLGQFEVRPGFSGSDRSANQQTGQNPNGQSHHGTQNSGPDLTGLAGLAELSSLGPVQVPTRRLLDLFA